VPEVVPLDEVDAPCPDEVEDVTPGPPFAPHASSSAAGAAVK
jgi:hypothetical protein